MPVASRSRMSRAPSAVAVRRGFRGQAFVTFACSSGERYLSTPLFDLIGKHTVADTLVRI